MDEKKYLQGAHACRVERCRGRGQREVQLRGAERADPRLLAVLEDLPREARREVRAREQLEVQVDGPPERSRRSRGGPQKQKLSLARARETYSIIHCQNLKLKCQ